MFNKLPKVTTILTILGLTTIGSATTAYANDMVDNSTHVQEASPIIEQQSVVKNSNQSFEQEVVDLVNEERATQGLKPLTLDTQLQQVAEVKSQDMKSNNYFDHTSPTYGSPFDMLKQFGIRYNTAGENIAWGQHTPEQVMHSWMNSSGHRSNILTANFTHVGVGFVDGYWTQLFIGKSTTEQPTEPSNPVTPPTENPDEKPEENPEIAPDSEEETTSLEQ